MTGLNLQRLYPLIALGLLAAASVWLERATRVTEERVDRGVRHDPDLMVRTFVLHRYDVAGSQQYQLTGADLTHFPDDDSSLITRPILEFTGEGRPMTVRGDQATVYQDGDRVYLEGNVQADRAGDAQHAPMSFRSPTLTVWPNEERGETRTPLVMTQGASVVHAKAMEAQNLIGEIILSGGVNARLQRNKANKP